MLHQSIAFLKLAFLKSAIGLKNYQIQNTENDNQNDQADTQ